MFIKKIGQMKLKILSSRLLHCANDKTNDWLNFDFKCKGYNSQISECLISLLRILKEYRLIFLYIGQV